jgi:hypothetical protein
MNAFVKTTKGNFPNVNFYLAWKGWDEMGYQVHKFEEEELDGEEIWRWMTKDTPVFAGVTVFDKIMKKLDVDYYSPGTYPHELRKFMTTEIKETRLGQVRHEFSRTGISIFVKPIQQKAFSGLLLKNSLSLISIANIPDECKVYTCYPVDFLSEFRVYVDNDEIIGVKHYAGDWTKLPDTEVIREAVDTFMYRKPSAYALDFGVARKSLGNITALIEFNDATSLGNYGLDSINYAEMLTDRWFDIIKKSDDERIYRAREEEANLKRKIQI